MGYIYMDEERTGRGRRGVIGPRAFTQWPLSDSGGRGVSCTLSGNSLRGIDVVRLIPALRLGTPFGIPLALRMRSRAVPGASSGSAFAVARSGGGSSCRPDMDRTIHFINHTHEIRFTEPTKQHETNKNKGKTERTQKPLNANKRTSTLVKYHVRPENWNYY